MIKKNYIQTIKNIKEEILNSRYKIATVANKELLSLYYRVGNIISDKVKAEKWGNKTIEKLSNDLQNELKGLRGFSYSNLKNMRLFFEEWQAYFNIENGNSQSLSGQLKNIHNANSRSLSAQFANHFINIGFTAHIEIIAKTKSLQERIFYITKTAENFWSVRTLRHQLKNKLFEQEGQLPNNFYVTIADSQKKEKALATFRDNYLLDFIRLSEEDENDEKVLENEIVQNIKNFIMSLGNGFAFIANQYRIIVDDEEYFIDLLFYNRTLKSLVAFELKTGKFKPEYVGKMNFYLSALDENVKQEHENPSIGIILCKEKKNKTVEFAFRDFNKAMGVATYNTANKLPEKYKNILPDSETLKKLMD